MKRGIVPSALTGSCWILEDDEFVISTSTVERERLPGDAAEDGWELTALFLRRAPLLAMSELLTSVFVKHGQI